MGKRAFFHADIGPALWAVSRNLLTNKIPSRASNTRHIYATVVRTKTRKIWLQITDLTLCHLKYTKSIMNVKLAMHPLNHSVSTALTYFEEEFKDASFYNASRTAKFCRMFNNAIDHFNCYLVDTITVQTAIFPISVKRIIT